VVERDLRNFRCARWRKSAAAAGERHSREGAARQRVWEGKLEEEALQLEEEALQAECELEAHTHRTLCQRAAEDAAAEAAPPESPVPPEVQRTDLIKRLEHNRKKGVAFQLQEAHIQLDRAHLEQELAALLPSGNSES
jgi:hypothetical protein